jgi:PBSX family phage terminase large subunit
MSSKEIMLLPHQMESIKSDHPEVLLLGGIGSGKSQLGAIWLVDKISKFPKCECLIAANTYSQLMNASVKTLLNYLNDMGIEYNAVLSGARKRVEIGKSTIYLYSLDKPDSIRGIEVSFSWLDEVAFSSLKALNVVRGRMRGNKSDYRQMLMTTSGNGFNFLYDAFGNLEGNDSRKVLISAKTMDNTFLPDGYYEELVENYGGEDTPLALQELMGKFVNLQEGAIYNLFDRAINVKDCNIDKRFPLYISVDFNIEIMSAVVSQYIGGELLVCEEIQLTHRNANTFDMAAHIIKEYTSKGYKALIIPDSTGRARKTSSSSGQTDHQILRDAGLTVIETSNPLIRDRQQSVNICFKRENIIIAPRCGQLIKDIETLSARDKEGNVSHLGPCLGYVVWYLMPIKRKTSKSRQINI